MKLKLLLPIALLAILAGVVAFVPARVLENPLNTRLKGAAVLNESRGTIWSGAGVLDLGSAGQRRIRVPLAWQFAPSSLFGLRLGFDVQARGDTLNGTARAGLGFSGVELRNVNLAADASLVASFNSIMAFAGPRGVLKLTTEPNERVVVGYGAPLALSGKLNARAENFAARTIFPQPVGTYQIRIVFREQVAEYTFADATGLLKLNGGGQLKWAPQREFTYAGLVAPSREAPLLLAALLPFGRPTIDGKVHIDYRTNW